MIPAGTETPGAVLEKRVTVISLVGGLLRFIRNVEVICTEILYFCGVSTVQHKVLVFLIITPHYIKVLTN